MFYIYLVPCLLLVILTFLTKVSVMHEAGFVYSDPKHLAPFNILDV